MCHQFRTVRGTLWLVTFQKPKPMEAAPSKTKKTLDITEIQSSRRVKPCGSCSEQFGGDLSPDKLFDSLDEETHVRKGTEYPLSHHLHVSKPLDAIQWSHYVAAFVPQGRSSMCAIIKFPKSFKGLPKLPKGNGTSRTFYSSMKSGLLGSILMMTCTWQASGQ